MNLESRLTVIGGLLYAVVVAVAVWAGQAAPTPHVEAPGVGDAWRPTGDYDQKSAGWEVERLKPGEVGEYLEALQQHKVPRSDEQERDDLISFLRDTARWKVSTGVK